ncbi:hypothetical protein [Alterinioella nitratireducens]|uniref:hypothetical protein n=1 Tax=Alterinioella nitratireducens TaxID=2735915 RepID=UPI00155199FB|nr:hypothetical protein [Alterinioella nitratireducens]NPD20970.1 hypothetical protein [Alterinioella nitratireducens]
MPQGLADSIDEILLNIDEYVAGARDELIAAGVNMSGINSIGVYVGGGGGGVLADGTTSVTILADPNNPENYTIYWSGEAGLGPGLSLIGFIGEAGAVGYTGIHDEYDWTCHGLMPLL